MHMTMTTTQLLDTFDKEITARGGRILETFHDRQRLFTRSVLNRVAEVRPGDRLQGGVALKATSDGVCLYPYVFRQVCRNGAIMAQTLGSRLLRDLHEQEPETVLETVREAIVACCEPDIFHDAVSRMRKAGDSQIDMALNLLPFLSRLPKGAGATLIAPILERFFRDGDRSQFGLGNAVTALARDTKDPDLRWNLEEFGGGILIGAVPRQPRDWGGAARYGLTRSASQGSRNPAHSVGTPVDANVALVEVG
jgi:hypothetical protein